MQPASTREQPGPRRRGLTNLPPASLGAELASAGFQNKPRARILKESYYRKRKIPAKHEVRGKKSPSSQQLFISCSHPNESHAGKPHKRGQTTEPKPQTGCREWKRTNHDLSQGPAALIENAWDQKESHTFQSLTGLGMPVHE